MEQEIKRLKAQLAKYEQEGICGYIHGKPNPETLCKHVLWAKQRKEEMDEVLLKDRGKTKEINLLVRENRQLRDALKRVKDLSSEPHIATIASLAIERKTT